MSKIEDTATSSRSRYAPPCPTSAARRRRSYEQACIGCVPSHPDFARGIDAGGRARDFRDVQSVASCLCHCLSVASREFAKTEKGSECYRIRSHKVLMPSLESRMMHSMATRSDVRPLCRGRKGLNAGFGINTAVFCTPKHRDAPSTERTADVGRPTKNEKA